MAEKIIKILEAGESCEVMASGNYGKITVNRPILHNFKRFPLIYMEPGVTWCACCEEDDGRLVVTIEGLGFANPRTTFADDGIELVSLMGMVRMEALPGKLAQVTIFVD